MTVEWKDPPERWTRERYTPWKAIADELRQRPGQWAIVMHDVASSNGYVVVRRLRVGDYSPFRPAGTFEARFGRTTPRDHPGKPRGDVYARYVGNVEPS